LEAIINRRFILRKFIILLVTAVFLSLACRAGGRGQAPEQVAAPTSTAASNVQAETIEPIASNLPSTENVLLLNEGNYCAGIAESTPGKSGVARGDDLHRITLQDERAVCNDGTPAVMYVREALTSDRATTWVFHFQGGGACQDYEVCLERWCGVGKYDAGKMSSRWAPETMLGKGLFNPSPANPWHDVNQVFVYYCSSDGWTGQANDVVLSSIDDPDQQMRFHAQGHGIITAVIETLMTPTTSDNGEMTMPALADATEIIFTGTSAGSAAVTQHLDWLAQQFDPAQTRVLGVIDAGSRPFSSDLPEGIATELDAFLLTRLESGYLEKINVFLDESCVEMSGDLWWQCTLNTTVHHNYLTTPFFIRMDLGDSLMVRDFVSLGGDPQDVAEATRSRLLLLQNIQETAAESASIETAPGIYGPACGQHVGLTSNLWYGQTTVTGSDGQSYTFANAIQAWADGESVVAVDSVPPSLSVCGETNDARD
jgi:hypothetical protein